MQDTKTYEAAVLNEQARWLVTNVHHSELTTDARLFVRKHHRDLSKGYTLH